MKRVLNVWCFSCLDLYAEYSAARAQIAISKLSLLPVTANIISRNSTQACTRYGLHPNTPALQRLYNDGDALFVANVGNLAEPLTKEEYEAKLKPRPPQLFAHNTQTKFSHTLDSMSMSRGDGVVGRMLDVLSGEGCLTGSYSIAGAKARPLQPANSPAFDVLSTSGSPKLDAKYNYLTREVEELTNRATRSPFGNTWGALLRNSFNRSKILNDALDSVTLGTTFRESGGSIGKQFSQVARLMKANQESFHNEREAYFVSLGGFDVHANAIDKMTDLMTQADTALEDFEAEMKLQGLWNNVTVVESSEFGRTISSNGDGSDHAWGGNYWIAGGAVKGGQILGQYPPLGEDSDVNLGRGRLLPTTSWEQVFNSIGEWFGVSSSDMDT